MSVTLIRLFHIVRENNPFKICDNLKWVFSGNMDFKYNWKTNLVETCHQIKHNNRKST
jgi:hypothetical protein